MLAQTRQVQHEYLLEFQQGFCIQTCEIGVVLSGDMCAAQIVIPVGTAFGSHWQARNAGVSLRYGLMFLLWAGGEVFIVKIPGLVVLLHTRKIGVTENLRKLAQLSPGFQVQLAVFFVQPPLWMS